MSFVEKDASSVKAKSKSLLASRETGLPSTAPGKCSDAEPAKRKLFVGMWQIHSVPLQPNPKHYLFNIM